MRLLEQARLQVPKGDPDATLMLQNISIIGAYLLSRIGYTDGVLKALSEAVVHHQVLVFPVGSAGTLELLAKFGVQLEDEAMTRSAFAAYRKAVPVSDDPSDQLDDVYGCHVFEQTFGTPETVLECGRGRDFRKFPSDDDQSEDAYASRALAYAQLDRKKEAEQDAVRMRDMVRTGKRLGTVPLSPRLIAWLDIRHGREIEGATKL